MSPDEAVAAIAARQHGALSIDQSEAVGLSRAARRQRVAAGILVSKHRSVLIVAGAPRTPQQDIMAMVLAYGPQAVASHTTAGYLLGIRDRPDLIHITLPTGQQRNNRKGARTHEANLARSDLKRVKNIPVTGPNRTLVDIASVATERTVESALDDAIQMGLTTVPNLISYISNRRLGNRPGVGALRRILGDRYHGVVHKELERLFRRRLKAANIKEDKRQYPIGPYKVDFAWPDKKIVIELDGLGGHFSAQAFRRDKKRDRYIARAGFTAYHYCWDDIDRDWSETEVEICDLLQIRKEEL